MDQSELTLNSSNLKNTRRYQNTDSSNLKKVYGKIYKLLDSFKLRFPHSALWNILIFLRLIITYPTLAFYDRAPSETMWRQNSNLAAGVKTYFEVSYYPALAHRYLKPEIQFVIMLILGILQVLPIVSLGLIVLFSKDYWFKTVLKKLFFNKYFSWFIYLLVEIHMQVFNDALKCSSSFGLVLKWADVQSDRPSLCGTEIGIGISEVVWIILGIFFLACTLINIFIYIGLGENTRISFDYLTQRRNLLPELISANMYFVFYLLNDVRPNSLIQLFVPVAGLSAMIYATVYKGSFVSQYQKYLHLTAYLTGLWFVLCRYANYILRLIDYQMEYPVTVFLLGYIGLLVAIIFKKKVRSIKSSLKNLSNFSDEDSSKYIIGLENLIILFKSSENNQDDRILLLGYVEEYQNANDKYEDSMISFSRLSDQLNYLTPEKYYQNLRDGFEKHISSLYLESFTKFPDCATLRISYAYFLNDVMGLKNQAITVCYSSQSLVTNFLNGYHYYEQKNQLESFQNEGDTDINRGGLKQTEQQLKANENIFLRSNKEDLLVKKNLIAIKRRQYRRLIRETISNYSDLWRELMEDTPDSQKVRSSLVIFDSNKRNSDVFWERYRGLFKESPQAMFDYGIYCIVVKSQETEGVKAVQSAKSMMVDSLKLQFDPKNLKIGLDLSKCSVPTAYLFFSENNWLIQDCNMAFAFMLMSSKTKLKNSNFIKLIPEEFYSQIHKLFKSQLTSDKVQDIQMFLYRQGTSISGFYVTLKTIKISEDKKFIAIQLSKNKHVYNYGVSIFDQAKGFIHANELFNDYFTFVEQQTNPNAGKMNDSVLGFSSQMPVSTGSKAKQNGIKKIKELNRQTLLKKINEFDKSKAAESKLEFRLQHWVNGEEKDFSLDLSKYFQKWVVVRIFEVYKNIAFDGGKSEMNFYDREANMSRQDMNKSNLKDDQSVFDYSNLDGRPKIIESQLMKSNGPIDPRLQKSFAEDFGMNQSHMSYSKSNFKFQFKVDLMKGQMLGTIVSKEEAKTPENYDQYRALLLRGMFNDGIRIGGKIMDIKNELLDIENRSRNMEMMDLSMNPDAGSFVSQIFDEFGNPVQKIDYGEGVRMMRLNREGRIIEIFESDEEDSSSKEAEEKNINKGRKAGTKNKKSLNQDNNVQKKGGNLQKQILQSRRGEQPLTPKIVDLKQIPEDKGMLFGAKNKAELVEKIISASKKSVVTYFIVYAILSILLFGVMSQINIFFQTKVVDRYDFLVEVNTDLSSITKECMSLKSSLNDVLLHNSGFPATSFDDATALEDFRLRVKDQANIINTKSQGVLNNIMTYNDVMFMDSILNNKTMKMKYTDTDSREVTFREGLTQVTSSALNLQKLELADITMTNSDLKFLSQNLLNGIADFLFFSLKFCGDEFRITETMREIKLIAFVIYFSIGLSLVLIMAFMLLMYRKNTQQDKLIDLFYGFSSSDCKQMTKVLDLVIQDIFLNEEYDFADEEINENAALGILEQNAEKKDNDNGSEILLVSRGKKKGRSSSLFSGSVILMMLVLTICILYFFLTVVSYGASLKTFVSMRVLKQLMTNMVLGGQLFETLFKTVINDPTETYLNNPAVWVAKFGYDQMSLFILNSTKIVASSFKNDEELTDIYNKTYVRDYCPYFESVKEKYMQGMERLPCKEVFPDFKDYVKPATIRITPQGVYMMTNKLLEKADEYRLQLFHYLTTPPNLVKYYGKNACNVPDSPYKGFMMLKCVVSDPEFRQFSSMTNILHSIVQSFDEEVLSDTETLQSSLYSSQQLYFFMFVLYLLLSIGGILIPFVIISENRVNYFLAI